MGRGGGGGGGGGAALLMLLAALLGEPRAARAAPPARMCPPCPPQHNHCKQNNLGTILNDECFYTVNNVSLMIVTSSKYFSLTCPEGVRLNSTSLPRFPSTVRVAKVTLNGCALPNEPYALALQRINVQVIDFLGLYNVPKGKLRADHFQNLDKLIDLDIKAKEGDFIFVTSNLTFTPLIKLKDLSLEGVRLRSNLTDLQNLTTLESLKLHNFMLRQLRRNQLCKLPALKKLDIRDPLLRSILDPDIPCNMTTVSLVAKNLENLPPFYAVQSLVLSTRMPSLQLNGCSNLENFTYINTKVTTLSDQWLSQCHQLKKLSLSVTSLRGPLTGGMLTGADGLRELKLTGCADIQLTNELFENTRRLKILNLSNNKLKELPSGVFSLASMLEQLDLSHNALPARALLELDGLRALRTLLLHDNPLGDLCDPYTDHFVVNTVSPLQPLGALEVLSLAGTGAARVCPDWRLNMRRLKRLYLENNNITTLEWKDLQGWDRDVEVNLKNNGLTTIWMNKTQYEESSARSGSVKFIIEEDEPMRCDCNIYWFAKAMKEHILPVTFETIRCLGPDSKTSPKLVEFNVDLMVCPIPIGCPEGCSCIWQPQNRSALIECSQSEQGVLPNVHALERELQDNTKMILRVNYRNMSVLPESLSPQVNMLDVRHNRLRADDAATARALVAGGRRAWLADNPLDCRCGQPLLREIRTHVHQIMDVDEARCVDGRPLSEALSEECSAGWRVWAGGAGGAAAALLLAAVAAAALQRRVRLRLKAFLLARGLCLSWVLPDDDDDCKYDAFLSYAHEDAELAGAVLAELESGPRPLRLCVHHRDWRPGEWIPKQIAESVKESRRTIILLSENFAKSSWARAEFREAYAHALREDAVRLVVVVLGEAPPADLDPDIRHFVSNNTYVRWGEPAFWEKLRLALPPGRLRPPPLQTDSPSPAKPKTFPHPPAPAAAPPARGSRRPTPLRTDPPVHPAPPQLPTPVVKFAHIDFPEPIKPAKNSAPPCA